MFWFRSPSPWQSLLLWVFLAVGIPRASGAQAPQSIQWSSPAPGTVLRLNESYPLAATASSGLPVSFELVQGPAILTNNSIRATNAGSVVLRTRQVGDERWYPVSESRLFNPLTVQATEISSILVSGRALDIELAGPLAYIANGTQGLVVVDVSTPEAPQYIDRIPLAGSAARVKIQGTLAYVVSIGVGLQVLDLSQPTQPVLRGTFPLEGVRPALKVVGQRAYLGDSQRGLVIVDVSDPSQPVQRGSIQTPGPANGIDVAGDRVYVAAGAAGLQTYGVSAPGSPSWLGGVTFFGEANDVQVQGTTAMVAAGAGWLRLVDISNPFAPQLQATLVTKGYASQVQWIGDKAFVAAASGGLQAVDLLLTEQRRVATEIPIKTSALGLEVAGQIAFVLTDHYGVRILRLRDGVQQRLTFTLPSQVSLINPVIPLNATIDSRMPITYSVVTGTATIDGQTLIGTTLGRVVVRAEQSGDSLFLPVQIDAGVTFDREPQTIQFLGPYKVFMTNPMVTLKATSSSGLPVAFRRRSGSAEVNGSVLTVTQAGTIGINVYQNGNTIYQPAPQLNVEIQALRSTQQVEFQPTNRIFLERPELPLIATSDVGLPVEFRVLSGPGLINGNTLTVTNPGVVVIRAIQPGNAIYEPAQVDRHVLVLAASGNGRSLFNPSLQLDLRVSGTISSLLPLPDGSVLIGAENDQDTRFIRLDPSGQVDPKFPIHSWDSWRFRPPNGRSALLGTNEVLISNTWCCSGADFPISTTEFYSTRLDQPGWAYINSVPNRVRPFSDANDGVVLVGSTQRSIPGTLGTAYYGFLGRLMPNKQWDPRIQIPPGMAPYVVRSQTLQYVHPLRDGSFVVSGSIQWAEFPYYSHDPNTEAFRMAADGSLLWRYTLDSPRWVTPITFVAEATNDRLVLFPSREVLDAATGRRIGRFPIPPDVIAATTAYFQEPDGRLILSGNFTNYEGIPRRGLAAILPDGSLDLSFNPGLGTTNGFKAIAREAGGALLLGGDPGTFDGVSHRGLVRLFPRNPDYTPPSTDQLQLLPPGKPLYECTESSELHVIRTGALTETHRVRIQTEAGTATPGLDFVPIDTELVFAPGERVKPVSLRILGDQPTESPESFAVRATPESGLTLLGTNVLTFQINDFVCGVAFQSAAFSDVESANPAGMRMWTAQDPPYGYTTRIRTRDVSARGGVDYYSYDGSPVANPGVPLRFIDNATFEGDRSFIVEAYDAETGLAIQSSQVLEVTIREDDSLAGPRRGVVGSLASIFPAPDGWILRGDFTSIDGLNRLDLASVRFDGSVNPAFAPSPDLDGRISLAVPVPGGGMLLAGDFTGIPSVPSPHLIELDAQGKVVPTFQLRTPGGSIDCLGIRNEVKAAVVLPNGRRFVAGNFPQFYGCSSDPRLLELGPDGEVIGSWPVPFHYFSTQFRFLVTSSDSWFLQGSSGVCRFTGSGLRFLLPIALEYPSVATALPDGSLAGVPLNLPIRLQTYETGGTLRAEVSQFVVDGELWESSQINGMTVRSDGWILFSGLFRSPSVPLNQYVPRTLAVNPASLATGTPAPALRMNDLWLTRMTTHPSGAVTGLQMTTGDTGPHWWRLDASGAAISDVAFSRIVADSEGRIHFALSGQAPGGYTIETSDDLVHWTPWFTSNETNWGMAFHTPPLPPELLGRFFRIR